jgi:nucleotide-binding universal stress UspA family protein
VSSPTDTRGRIVVGYDGSDAGRRAVRWAADEARTVGCSLELVLAYDDTVPAMSFGLSNPPAADSPSMERAISRRARDAVQAVAAETADAGLAVTATATAGRPGPVLVAAAQGARLLVVGASHHSAFSRVVIGSTVTHCQRHALCPVVVVRTERSVGTVPVRQTAAAG